LYTEIDNKKFITKKTITKNGTKTKHFVLFFYAIIMVIDIILFIIIAYFYEYVNSSETATVHIDDTAGLVDKSESIS
jgi:hypothetical protein